MLSIICHVEGCENHVGKDRWLEHEYYCERTLPEEHGNGRVDNTAIPLRFYGEIESVRLRAYLCERHYRLLYIQPNRYPDAVSMPT